jgi:hypothetical protein
VSAAGETKLKLKMIFKKSAGRVQNSMHLPILSYTRRDKLFISLALEFSTRFRGGSFHPPTHLSALDKTFDLGTSVVAKSPVLRVPPDFADGLRPSLRLTPATGSNPFNQSRITPESDG